MATYQVISIIVLLAAVFAYVNDRWIKWPPTIGIMVLALFSSILIVILGNLIPAFSAKALSVVSNIDFGQVLMKIMLSFLLFAGAIHIDADKLKKEFWPVITLATVGIFISTFLVSLMAYYLFQAFQLQVSYIHCLLFGALISPTDPIAVMAILKQAGIPKSLELKIMGESLFNDGVAVVVFLTILEVASKGTGDFSASGAAILFLKEAGGGLLFGGLMGYIAYFLIRSIDNYRVEVLITLAVVMCGYTLADDLHVSGPLAIIVTGIIVGTKGRTVALSPTSRDYLLKFWDLIDEIFNAVLFLLIGLQMLVIRPHSIIMLIGCIMILVVLLARWISVFLPVAVLRLKIKFEKNVVAILTWGGLRGGLSVAMALSLPSNMHRDELVLITYIIVIFSIIAQGLTIGKVAARLNAS
ncbi:MAG TPA: sodium:proton antiporter [Mucilaginibacter sp.]|nr:sodium:proton antiporter [Mucilaginibacter sp.]